MRLVFVLLFATMSIVPLRAHADVCAASSVDCQAGALEFADRSGLFDAIRYDTGFLPQGSPFQIRAALFLGAGTHVGMSGWLVAEHPPALQLSAKGDPEGGMLELDFGFEAVLQGRLDVLGIDETFNIPIPNVPRDLRFYALERFDPFLLGAATPADVEDTIQRFTLVQIDLFDLIAPIPGFDGGLRVDVAGRLGASYRGARLEVEGVGDFDDDAGLLMLPPHLPEGYGAFRELRVIKHGVLQHRGALDLYPTLFISIFGVEAFETDIASIPVNLGTNTTTVRFDPALVRLRFADVQAEPSALDFGELFVGQSTERFVRIQNDGEAPLRWSLPASIGGFAVTRTEGVVAPGAAVNVRVIFAPSVAGVDEETLVLSTNDPDRPEVFFALVGEARATPSLDGGVGDGGVDLDGGLDPDGGDGDGGDWEYDRPLAGCGCDASSRGAFPLLELAFLAGALALHRRRAARKV